MRADRLVALLLLLQRTGRITAAEAARELEVSERTARRDLEALCAAGLPIYSQQGRGGGWVLLNAGRTDLSGLTDAEARALFLVAGPSSGATPEVRAALRKLVRALPEPFRDRAERAARSVVVDPVGWGHVGAPAPPLPHLDAVQRAVAEALQADLAYVARDGSATHRRVHPLGLASKGPIWYLVAGTDAGLRTFRVDRIRDLVLTDEPVVRPDGFDLGEAWTMVVGEIDARRAPHWAQGTITVDRLALLRSVLGTRLRIGPPAGDGRVHVECGGATYAVIAAELAGLADSLEFTDPPEVRDHMASIGRRLVERYS